MLVIDGAEQTGGGQLLRTALALSAHTNKPFKMINIRAGRPRPGLFPSHLECVRMMQQLCNADVKGAYQGSTELEFVPRGFTPKTTTFNIGTAGPVTFLLQTLMIPAMHHKKTTYTMRGGTDVRWSPTIDYARHILAPTISHFGEYKIDLKRRGFFPKGGGHIEVTFGQKRDPQPLTLLERGTLQSIEVFASASQTHMEDQLLENLERTIRVLLANAGAPLTIRNTYVNTMDEGYSISIVATHTLGEPRHLIGADVRQDDVGSPQEAAEAVCRQFLGRLNAQGAIDEHLADHLIPFIALHGGEFSVTRVSSHIRANMWVCEQFLNTTFSVHQNTIRAIIQH